MQVIPIQPIPSQIITPSVNGQLMQLKIYQLSTGLYMDVLKKAPGSSIPYSLLSGGVQCHNLHVIVRWQYLGFVGDLLFSDQQGLTDPFYTQLGSRYLLFYLFPGELPGEVF